MEKLLDSVAAIVLLISPEKVEAIASKIRHAEPNNATASLLDLVGTPGASGLVGQLVESWKDSTVNAGELASMLLAASYISTKTITQQSVELVWTGPTTPFVSARRTEQALLQVINAATETLFITSFVAYEIPTIVKALGAANNRGVQISMLLESSQEHGGTITVDAIGKMRTLVPSAQLYAWQEKVDPFLGGRVHAKVAVADDRVCFITSANLTGHAMEKNMEAGVLVSGSRIPKLLSDHLRALVDTKVVSKV